MASWFYRIFLAAFFAWSVSLGTLAQQHTEVIEPDLDRREVKVARIDNEFIEFGIYGGIISIEDFDTSEMVNIRLAVHLNERIFIEGSYGQAKGDLTSFEEIVQGSRVVTDGDRDYKSWDVSFGWNIFPNESWLLGRAFKTDVYLLTGVGSTDFGGDKWTTINIGVGYHIFLTDWLTWRLEVRDHIFNRDIFTEDDQTNNIEFSTGFGFFF